MRDREKYRSLPDAALTAAVKEGDDRAFDALFLRWYPQVRNFLLSLVRENALAEDLSQSVFMKVWNNRDRLDPSLSLKNYLFILARNGALDYFRSKRHLIITDTERPPEKTAQERTEAQTEYVEVHSQILRIVDNMPPQRRQVFKMSRFQQRSSDEIARELGLSVRTVEKHIQLALQDIRKYLS